MPSSGSCGASTRGVIFNFGYLGTNKKQSPDPDTSCHKYPIPDDTPLPFGHRKIMPDQGYGPPIHQRRTSRGADRVTSAVTGSGFSAADRVARVSGPVEWFGVGERAAQPGLVPGQDADLEVRLPFRLGRGDLAGGAEPCDAGIGEPGILPRPRRCGTVWVIGGLAPIPGGVQFWDGSWWDATTTTAVAASVAGTCHSCSSHRRHGRYRARGCAVGNRDAADLSRWRTQLGRMRRAGQRHSPQAAGVHQDRGSLATHAGVPGDRERQSGSGRASVTQLRRTRLQGVGGLHHRLMTQAGSTSRSQTYKFPYFAYTAVPVFSEVSPTAHNYVVSTDFNPGQSTGTANAAALQPAAASSSRRRRRPSSSSGCTMADFGGFVAGRIALIQRGRATSA